MFSRGAIIDGTGMRRIANVVSMGRALSGYEATCDGAAIAGVAGDGTGRLTFPCGGGEHVVLIVEK